MKQLQPQPPTQDSDALAERERVLFEQAAEKVVRFGQQVGVTPEDMIQLLDSGISVRDLLAFLASKTSGMDTATRTFVVVRCPYCVSGEEFRLMVAHRDGRYICGKCGHLANPSRKDFKCSCSDVLI